MVTGEAGGIYPDSANRHADIGVEQLVPLPVLTLQATQGLVRFVIEIRDDFLQL